MRKKVNSCCSILVARSTILHARGVSFFRRSPKAGDNRIISSTQDSCWRIRNRPDRICPELKMIYTEVATLHMGLELHLFYFYFEVLLDIQIWLFIISNYKVMQIQNHLHSLHFQVSKMWVLLEMDWAKSKSNWILALGFNWIWTRLDMVIHLL